jgi:N-methylhydantoinase A/oxoprolinase/acetone carboxylase beta subunit
MNRIILLVLLIPISSFALTLDQVRNDLKNSSVDMDSIEMDLRTTVNVVGTSQSVTIYVVQKGTSKIYTEINTSFMSQHSIVNGSKMKVVDLKTNKVQIVPYNGEALEALKYTQFNPLDAGEWETPKYVDENLYAIKGDKGTLYYNSKKKRIEKLESEKNDSYSLTTFEYNAENKLKMMKVDVDANGVKTTIVTEILRMKSSKDFPDKLFEF